MKKRIITIIAIVVFCCSFLSPNFCVISNAATTGEGANILATDTIVYKFRIYNGKQQYRRWNATKGVWVDPHWITIP